MLRNQAEMLDDLGLARELGRQMWKEIQRD